MPGDGEAPGKLPDAPTEADIRELYTALELNAQGEPPPEDQAAASKAGCMVYQLQARIQWACELAEMRGAETLNPTRLTSAPAFSRLTVLRRPEERSDGHAASERCPALRHYTLKPIT